MEIQAAFRPLRESCRFPAVYRHSPGGLVICREPLTAVTPLQPAAKGVLITQFDKDDIEDLGLIKLDLLSLRTLSAVEDTVISINSYAEGNNGTPEFCYEKIPLDDESTYRRLNTGTIGAFRLEAQPRALQARLGQKISRILLPV